MGEVGLEGLVCMYKRTITERLELLEEHGVYDVDDKRFKKQLWMLDKIRGWIREDRRNPKAHRWLGYIQAQLEADGYFTLDQLREQTRFALAYEGERLASYLIP